MKSIKTYLPLIGLVFFSTLLTADAWARAGGGGGSGRGKGGIVGLIVAPFLLVAAWRINKKINAKSHQVRQALQRMRVREPAWSEELLISTARISFLELQNAWGKQDLPFIEQKIHPLLFPEWKAQIQSQIAVGEFNRMMDIAIQNVRIVDVQNYQDNERDCFTVCIDAYACDQTIDRSGTVVKQASENFREFWTFEHEKGEWKLLAVYQKDAWEKFTSAQIVDESPQSGDRLKTPFKKVG